VASENFNIVIRAKDEASLVLDRISTKVLFLADGTVHKFGAVAKASDGAAAGFTRLDLRAAMLGARLGNLPPILNNVVSAFAFGNAGIAALSIGIGVLASQLFDSDSALQQWISGHDESAESIRKHRKELDELGGSTSSWADQAQILLALGDKAARQELAKLERTASLAKGGREESSMLHQMTGSLRYVNINRERQIEILSETIPLISALTKELGILEVAATGPFGPPTPTYDEWVAMAEGPRKAAAEIAKLIEVNNAFNFQSMDQIGTFEVLNKAWRERAAFMDAAKEAQTTGAMDQMSTTFDFARSVWADQAAASDKLKEESARNFDEFANMIGNSMTNAADQLVGIMFGVKTSFAEIFKGMAQDWFRFFISRILQNTAANLATSILSSIPGLGPILGVAGGGLGKTSAGAGGLDISSAGAGRFSGQGTARRANVQVVIQGDVIGEQEYVTRKIIPAIEQAIAYGQSRLAVR